MTSDNVLAPKSAEGSLGGKEDRTAIFSIMSSFSPIMALSRLAHRILRPPNAESAASIFFDSGRFWERKWDIYCSFPDARLSKAPLLLVPVNQVQRLLQDIHDTCQCIDNELEERMKINGYIIDLPQDHVLQPLYVGCSSSKDDYHAIQRTAAGLVSPNISKESRLVSEQSLGLFKTAMGRAVEANRSRFAPRREQKVDREYNEGKWDRQCKRTERYLGLRRKTETGKSPENDSSLTWEELELAIAARDEILKSNPVISNRPAPFSFDKNVVFIAIDVESYEQNHNIITEIGFASLDTKDIEKLPPGTSGINWQSKVNARHIRIKENMGYHNSKFVDGCADKFEFGSSEVVEKAQIHNTLAECFRYPLRLISSGYDNSQEGSDLNQRNIVVVGHDVRNDIKYLQKLGYNLLQLSNVLEVIDTVALDKAWKEHSQPRSLGTILYELDMPSWHLHNAGNDAVYTLWAMLGVTIQNADKRAKREQTTSTESMRYDAVRSKEPTFDWIEDEHSNFSDTVSFGRSMKDW